MSLYEAQELFKTVPRKFSAPTFRIVRHGEDGTVADLEDAPEQSISLRSAAVLTLDIAQALRFLDALDPGGRHTLASEAPFGGEMDGPNGSEARPTRRELRPLSSEDIGARQARGSNVYYGVNRPCPVWRSKRIWHGKCNVDDIIAIRALAFDIDHCHDISLIETGLSSALRPSFIINTGGGLHLIYLLKETINVNLYLPPKTDDEKAINKILDSARSAVTVLGNDFETCCAASSQI